MGSDVLVSLAALGPALPPVSLFEQLSSVPNGLTASP